MDSGSQTDKPPQERSHTLANIIGTLIALLTLIAPVLAIASFSNTSNDLLRSPTYQLLLPKRQ
ncbi:MAG: hypothetical protein ACFB8W_18160 [Elainellaceae cyanobacterium]